METENSVKPTCVECHAETADSYAGFPICQACLDRLQIILGVR